MSWTENGIGSLKESIIWISKCLWTISKELNLEWFAGPGVVSMQPCIKRY